MSRTPPVDSNVLLDNTVGVKMFLAKGIGRRKVLAHRPDDEGGDHYTPEAIARIVTSAAIYCSRDLESCYIVVQSTKDGRKHTFRVPLHPG